MNLSVIIPAYNEEGHIKETVSSIVNYLSDRNKSHEIIVVENASQDKTAEIVKGLAGRILSLRLIQTDIKGKGHAVKVGVLKARGDYLLLTDADNSTSIDHIEKMMPYFEENYDIVIGSIGIAGSQVAPGSEPPWRRLLGKLGNLFIQIMAVWGIKDTQRGFKLMTKKAAGDIFPRLTIGGWGFDVEMLALAKKFGYKIKEVPVDWKNDPHSHIGLKAYFQVLVETVKIRWNLWTNKYKNVQ
ncbi:MAG: glycosyltransferase family 2 protein [Deltaproteobacteria bacterium]|nr:glycosyltransferase family 2 protein [Deltaproteobacteria bacterium]